jgi:predicted O-methyltransferase YrrM
MKVEPRVETVGVVREDDKAYNGLYFKEDLKTNYYNYYYSYGRHFKPKSIFEIGVRAGYTGYFLLKGSGATKYRGIDLECYMKNSNKKAEQLLSRACDDVLVTLVNSHSLSELDQKYDMIHVDGDHTYKGKVQDLELALENLAEGGVIVVDDYTDKNPTGKVVKKATDFVIKKHGLAQWDHPTYTGHTLLARDESAFK